MSDSSFGAFVPGFDFLQGLVKNAGAAIPGFNQWVAPTLNPQELEKRINELRTVHFWLEQNARMLATTIQALEVQKMTLSTLSAMNVPMGDLKQGLKMPPMPDFAGAMGGARSAAGARPGGADIGGRGAAAQAGQSDDTRGADDASASPEHAAAAGMSGSGKGRKDGGSGTAGSDGADKPGAARPHGNDDKDGQDGKAAPLGVDPMQWWNALTQQFTQIASQAMKDNTLVKQGLDAAGETFRKAAAMPGDLMNQAAKAAQAAASAGPSAEPGHDQGGGAKARRAGKDTSSPPPSAPAKAPASAKTKSTKPASAGKSSVTRAAAGAKTPGAARTAKPRGRSA